ncbi:MAG: hypothetical protein ACXABY_00545 [Candidatus Thorarchaeota archaeon]
MKSYPAIPQSTGQKFRAIGKAHVFDKLDGSNLRFEWSRKKGFWRQGTRKRLFDESDRNFGDAIEVFHKDRWPLALSDVLMKHRIESAIAFFEYWGDNSFAGNHKTWETQRLTLIDVAVIRKGILPPAEFIKMFGHLGIAKYFGVFNWTRGFVESVRDGGVTLDLTFEGVVGKVKDGRKIVMAKAKTQRWIDKVREQYAPEDAERIIQS